MAATALAGGALLISPALSAASRMIDLAHTDATSLVGIRTFTPVAIDSRLADSYSRVALNPTRNFRFTPTSTSVSGRRSVTVAVRTSTGMKSDSVSGVGITPLSYSLGVARGWKKFALSDSVGNAVGRSLGKSDSAALPVVTLPGADSFKLEGNSNKRGFSTTVEVDGDRAPGNGARALTTDRANSVDVMGSYSLTRNINVMAGVRYRGGPTNRLTPLTDDRSDSQAVYVGTAFKF